MRSPKRDFNKRFNGKRQVAFTCRVTPLVWEAIVEIQRSENISLNKAVSDLVEEALESCELPRRQS